MIKAIQKWLNKDVKPAEVENTFTPAIQKENTYIPKFICVQSSCDLGQGLSFNEKANHIFSQIKGEKKTNERTC